MHEAARIANSRGWLVRAYEPQAWLTADMRENRMNLCYSTERVVTFASLG